MRLRDTLRLSRDEHGIHIFAIDDLDVCKTKQLQSRDRVGLWHHPIGDLVLCIMQHPFSQEAAPKHIPKEFELPIKRLAMGFPFRSLVKPCNSLGKASCTSSRNGRARRHKG